MSPEPATAHVIAKRGLREFGITSLDPALPLNQRRPIEDGDLEEVCTYMTSSLQEMFDLGPAEMKQRPGSGYLNAPTAISITVTQGSTDISAVTTFADWMLGCTVRIAGDDQDNELVSETLLARPYLGTSGTFAATIYGDCLTLDDTISEVLDPVFFSNQAFAKMAQSREQFIQLGLYPSTVTYLSGAPIILGPTPFYWYGRKGMSQWPYTWLVEGCYDSSLDYVPRRLRFAPMPTGAIGVSYTAIHTPPRIDTHSVDNGDHQFDPGVKLPIPNGWLESIFLPIFRQQLTGSGLFQNSSAVAEIGRSYGRAVKRLEAARGGSGGIEAKYPRVY